MKNNFNLFLSILFFSTLFLTTTQATTITWSGADGDWNDSNEWDTGTVPVLGDDVIIPGGRVYINSGENVQANSIEVRSGGRLIINEDGAVEIHGTIDRHALHNMGKVFVRGDLSINSVTRTSSSASAKAIYNQAFIFTYSNSTINIKYIDDDAIYNSSYSYIKARGSIWIYQSEGRAIYNADRFYNLGQIGIDDCGASNSFAMTNSRDFRNYSTGTLMVKSDIYGGISNNGSNGLMRNYGVIEIEESTIGLNNSGLVTNYNGAQIDVEYVSSGFYNRSTGTINNYGRLNAHSCGYGVINYGIINNYSKLYAFNSNSNSSIYNLSGGTIDNYNDIYLSATSSNDLWNYGEILNHQGAIFECNKKINIYSGASFVNNGFMASHSTANHIITGSLVNNGAIDDNHATFPSTVDNQKIIVARLAGSMTEGVPFPNVLDVASISGFTIEDWLTAPAGGTTAGIYDAATNEFTPNANAVGLNTIYIRIRENTSGFSRNFSLEIDGGILAAGGGSNMVIQNDPLDIANEKELLAIDVFPNPSSGSLQIKSELFEGQATQVQVFNALGQLVQHDQINEGGFTHTLNFSSELVNGIYILKLIQNKKEISTERIHLQR